ncbi:uncharacterized protein KIAA1958-like [Mytilus edulis]|uniref:uncharacterized protein KIAA1958-like n=1 Tax=Mytilus edulis TaxID=6550 RepID=UPI0039EF290D
MMKDLDVIDMLCDIDTDISLTQLCANISTDQFLGDDDENNSLSQIAAQAEKEFFKTEDTLDINFNVPIPDLHNISYGDFHINAIADLNNFVNAEVSTDDENSRFGNLTTEDDMNELISENIPKNTKKNTSWAKNVFNAWRNYRTSRGEGIPEIEEFSVVGVNKVLSRFIVEVRKKNGDFYPPKSLYLLSVGLLRSIRDAGISMNFMDERDDTFLRFRRVLDSQMKSYHGMTTKQADPISQEQELMLWEKEIVGYDSSAALLIGVFFYNCKLFGMRGRIEHHSLDTSQINIGTDDKGKNIQFTETNSKTFKGGLKQKNVENKNIKHYANASSDKDLYKLYELYIGHSKSPEGNSKFYKRPLRDSLRFSKQNLGINKLENLMKTICNKAGLSGNFTNHTGKCTCATTMFQSGIVGQTVMSRTGHCSVQGVRKYKRPSDDQLRDISNVLEPNCKSSKIKTENNSSDGKENEKCHIVELQSQSKSCVPFGGFNICYVTFNIGK